MKPHPPNSLPSGRDVLVVEDELRLRTMLSQALTQMGYKPTLASSAEAAGRALDQSSFDILILDPSTSPAWAAWSSSNLSVRSTATFR